MAKKPAKKRTKAAPVEPAPAREWEPRAYQQAALDAFHAGKRRLLLVWHRRAGKDRFGLELVRDELETSIGGYWHLYPLHVQARRAIWQGVDPATGVPFMSSIFPASMRADTHDRDMLITFKNNSTYQLLGSDYYDRLVGSNIRGVLFSEWALCDPRAWPYIMPILVENGGWAVFITTYRGRNHAYQMAKRLAGSPEWYVDVRTILQTTRHDGTPVVSEADVARERESVIATTKSAARADATIREEFYCDPMASLPGSIYGKAVALMQSEGRA